MEPTTANKLISLNQQFYQTFAHQFSITRMRLQPGVRRVLDTLQKDDHILDLGCGNGELARELDRRAHRGIYTGLDFSSELLFIAEASLFEYKITSFLLADLTSANWNTLITNQQFDVVLAFAVLHHLPGDNLRQQFLLNVRAHTKPMGQFIHSEWQFLNSPRLRSRIQPWDEIGLSEDDVEDGDYLLDWRRGGYGLRYVHHFTEDELAELAAKTGFILLDSFLSDGEEGKLGLYQMWEPI